MEALIQKYKDDWDSLYGSLFDLREEVEAGRKPDPDGVSPKAAPFYDLIGQLAFGDAGIPEKHQDRIKQLVGDVIERLQDTINIINFWSNAPEISKLKGSLSDLMLLTGIDEIIKHSEKLVTEITALAKVRHEDILK